MTNPTTCYLPGAALRSVAFAPTAEKRSPRTYTVAIIDAQHGTAMSVTLNEDAARLLGERVQKAVAIVPILDIRDE